MEQALEEVVGGSSNKDLFHIVKGKRTKRLRLQSPNIPFSATTSHRIDNTCNSSNNNDDAVEDVVCNSEDIACNNNNNNNNEVLSSAASSEAFINTFTEEEEETAKCLVLLSKGHDDDDHDYHPPRPPPPRRFIMDDNNNNVDFFNDDDLRLYKTKFNSKRYIETSTNSVDGTKAGIYVYECKTCYRTFSSFQALGGHRASHKKPKTLLNTEFNKKSYLDFSDEDDYYQQQLNSPSTTTTTTTLYNKNNKMINKNLPNSSNNNKYYSSSPRTHECSYCGAEFTSGQALGGHMRRHRGGANINSPFHLTNLPPSTTSIDQFGNNNTINNSTMKKQRDHELSLDLNLPVQHDPLVSLKQQDQEQTQRQLVDCHY